MSASTLSASLFAPNPRTMPAPTSAASSSPATSAEHPVVFVCEGEHLLGVLHRASLPEPATLGVLIVVGGPQVRAGSHRQFVQLARTLASAGHPVLRFDVRGMGDSTGAMQTFEQITPDIGAAIDTMMAAHPQLRGVVLWGLCDGASAALLYLHERRDARVLGLCLLNPWVRSEATRAQVQVRHYYTGRLLQTSFWRKLIAGDVGFLAVRNFWRSLKTLARSRQAAPLSATDSPIGYIERMAAAWKAFPGPMLLLLSENDFTAREFETTLKTHTAWRGAASHPRLRIEHIAQADHTLSATAARQCAEGHCKQWLSQLAAPTGQHP